MKRIILSTLVALTALGGVASADRWQSPRHAQGGVTVAPSHRHYQQPRGYYQQRPRYTTYSRGYYVARPTYRYVRRPIFVQRPVITYRYNNYAQRPAVIAESYSSMPGYYWVAGHWDWSGYQWQWNPGHYEPDPNAAGYYSNDYDSTYYQSNPSYDQSYQSNPSYDQSYQSDSNYQY
jgi:hypothetical protein